jgi:hypothetical protein
MELETLRGVLGWCTIFGWAILLLWWAMVVAAGDWMHGLHGKWFELSRSTFYAIHYAGMGLLKLLILVFNLLPYLALRIVA